MKKHPVFITGIGILSSLGEGVEAHWNALNNAKPHLESERFAPYTVHPMGEVDWSQQIPKRSDQRQMETWQRLGTYAAGLALDDAGMKDNEALTSTMDMIVSAGGGERDIAVDAQILAKARETDEPGVLLNQMLSTELRPTLFLAQLSNLLAGNISIVHKVTGSSRTFMGEEGAGLSAIQVAVARIRAGQSSHILVGGAYNAEHFDMLLGQELNQLLSTSPWAPVWERIKQDNSGFTTGSGGIFLVLESADHAHHRNARVYAEITDLVADQTNRMKQPLDKTLSDMINQMDKTDLIVSAATGAKTPTVLEKNVLDATGLPYRGVTSLFGHMREAQFPFALALAAIAVQKQQAFKPLCAEEKMCDSPVKSALVTGVGVSRAEGIARLVNT